MKKKLVLISILFILISCESDRFNKSKNLIDIHFDEIPIYKKDTSVVKKIRYIPLETDKDVLITQIDKILFVNEHFYILDSPQKTIFIFDNKGSFINRIHRIGKGPGEYVKITDFDIDKNNCIYVYDNISSKILKYGQDLQSLEKISLKYRFEEFAIIGNSLLLRNVYDHGNITLRIARYNLATMKLEPLIDVDEYPDDFNLTRFSKYSFFRSARHIYFNARFTPRIYTLGQDSILEHIIDINGTFPTEEFLSYLSKDYRLAYRQNTYIIDIRNIYENSSVISMNILKGLIYTLLISKDGSKEILLPGIQDKNYFGDHSIYGVAEEEFISRVNPQLIAEEDWSQKVNQSSLSLEDKRVLLNIKVDDNPVLALLEFKNL